MRKVPNIFELNALSITLYYLVFAILWILISDQVLIWITESPELISQYQTYKGLFYVFVTGVVLFYLIDQSNKKITSDKQQLEKSLEATNTATWQMNLETEDISFSKHLYKVYGLKKPPKQNEFQSYFQFIHPEDQELVQHQLEKIRNKKAENFFVDFRVTGHDNSTRWLRSHGTLIPGNEYQATVLAGVIKDITKQKELQSSYEREKELFESIFQHIPVMIDVISDDMKAIRVNKKYEEVTGYTEEEIQHKNIMDEVYPDPDEKKRAKKVIEEADGTWHEFENYTKDGDKRIQQWANIQLSDGSTIGIGLDVTEKKQLEKKQERDRLELQKIYDNIPVFISLYRENNEVHRVNQHFENVLGYSNKDLDSADLVFEMIPNREDRLKAEKHLNEADGSWLDFKLTTKDGTVIDSTWSVIPVTNSLKMGIGLDITDLKATQAEIKESRELLKKIFESLQESIIIVDPETRTIADVNQATCKIFGYSEEELIGSSTEMLHVSQSHYEEFDKMGEKDLNEYGVFTTEFMMQKKDGTKFHSDHTVAYVYNDQDEIDKAVSVVRDITEQKKYEQKLRNLANRYRDAEKLARIGHWKRNIQTDEAVWSQGFYNIIGLEPGGRDTSYESLLEMMHPEDREEFNDAFKEAAETGTLNISFRIIKPSTGEIGYYHGLGEMEYDEDGTPLILSGTMQDVTKIEKFQIELHKRNKFIETTLENLPIGVAVNYIDSGEASLMNKKFSEIYGWPQEVLKDVPTFYEKVYPDENYRQKMIEMISADIASENPERMHWKGVRITTQSGKERIIDAKNIPVYDQNLMISTVMDVTAQNKAEQRLAESEHNYRLLFQKSPQPMWIYNPESLKFVEVNSAACKHYGYSRKEFYQMTLMDIRPEEDHEALKQDLAKNRDESLSNTNEWRHLKKSGEIIFVRITGSSINYFGNDYRLILVNDITEQKKAEQKVLASLVEGENKERARIAQELHDGLGQYLAAANMNFDSVSSSIDKLDERKRNQFLKGHQLLKHAVSETGQISRNLLPRVVDDYGLALALDALVDSYSGGTDIKIKYYHNTKNLKLPREVQLNLYRIIQEALSNAIKYSEASIINVQLLKDELDLILSIDDNGIGFDTKSEDFSPGLGLQTIKSRVGALGGDFEFDSRPNQGTFINVVVPIHMNTNNG